ncbi:LysR substrate-binding domain-containing protein [Bordetella ansorpii]|nr:LysR substrate-binding domain-containing protein [Bordetella ansorpii]
MELRQISYFISVVELGSMGKAALSLGVTASTLSQQISRLEGELSTVLLQRSSTGVVPTEAGLEFLRRAKTVMHHVEMACTATQSERLSGKVSIGMAPTIALRLALPLLRAMQQRYPKIRVQIVEGMSGHLTTLFEARKLDFLISFDIGDNPRLGVFPLLREGLFVMGRRDLPGMPDESGFGIEHLEALPLVMPTGRHTLVTLIMNAFRLKNVRPNIVLEVDGLNTLMGAVQEGMGAAIHPSSAMALIRSGGVACLPIVDPSLFRTSILIGQPDEELTPAALATRLTLKSVARTLIEEGRWEGARLELPSPARSDQ